MTSEQASVIPPSQLEGDPAPLILGTGVARIISKQNSSRTPRYRLAPEEQTQKISLQEMLQVPPPETAVLGGVSQSQSNAPVQFYRFSKERKQRMKAEMYQDPFNPTATEGNASSRQPPMLSSRSQARTIQGDPEFRPY